MPQARLPDVNTAFIKWRNKIVTALEAEKFTAAVGSLNNFNACLPKEYQVQVSSELYAQKLGDEKVLVHCAKCNNDVDYRHVRKMEGVCSPSESLVSQTLVKAMWICSLCQAENLTTRSEFIKTQLPNPSYLGVVQDPPKRKDGILDRHSYQKKLEHWVWTMMGELEFKAAKYRDDSWQKAIQAGYDIIDGGEQDDQNTAG